MIQIKCPHCQFTLNVKQVKSGKFLPTCNRCKQRFELTIASENDVEPVIRAISDPTIRVAETRAEKQLDQKTTRPDQREIKTQQAPAPATRKTEIDKASASALDAESPKQLAGYRIVSELGRGGLGVVYLATQLSLKRNVALKVVRSHLADQSRVVSRFIREAYAAAQLTHHNVVQIYDMGRDGRTSFFSMEFVQGQDLAQLLKSQKRLEPEQAAGYILQAARGLQFAHNQGMVHRDIKPANLLLNDLGIVKVADLGIVKWTDDDLTGDGDDAEKTAASSRLTQVGSTLGTASYMAPEQADDSSKVDHRADIYALGCTFYGLLTGKPPFSGTSVVELITKHREEPVVRPELVVDRIDSNLSDIVVKMVAKDPGERFENMGQVITELESYLGISSSEVFSPSEQQVALLEKSKSEYDQVPMANVRQFAPIGLFGFCIVAVIFCSFVGWRWVSGCVVFLFLTPISYFLISGWQDQTHEFEKARELASTFDLKRWAQIAVVGILALVLIYVSGALGICIVSGILAVTLAAIFYLGVDRQIALQRKPAIESVEELVKKLRISGVEESSIQRFIAKYSGSNWEEYFQDIFGYEAMRSVRADASWQAGSKRKRFRPVRDFLIDRMEERLSVARSRRDRKKLQKIEQEALVESGMSEDEAATKADQFSKALVDEAAAWRRAATEYRPHAPIDPVAAAQAKRQRIKAMLADARSGKYRRRPLAERLEGPFDLLLGNHVRLMLGCLLIAGCTLWAQQNGIFDTVSVEKIRDVATTTVDQGGTSVSDAAKQIGISSDQTQPLNWPIVGSWFDSFGSGVAGLILLVTALFRGWRMSLFALPAAVVAWLGPSLGIPPIPGWCDAQITSILAGVGIGIIGILFGRTRY